MSTLAQQPMQQIPRVKGPRVWLDMDQKELDDAYDQSVWAPNQSHVSKRRAVWSEAIRARVKSDRVAYGPTEIEKLDIYKTTRWNAPIRIFLHGGAWRGGSAKDSAYPAEMFVSAGCPLCRGGFRISGQRRRKSHADGRSGAPRRGLGL
jgi:arylformamidase